MKSRINVLTLGVRDLEKSVAFYRSLGFHTDGIIGQEFEYGAVAFFDLQAGLRLALWPRTSIAQDTGLNADATESVGFTIGHNVNTKDEVDLIMNEAIKAGASIVKSAADTFYGGYAGYFQDIDGHLWEVVYNPEFVVED